MTTALVVATVYSSTVGAPLYCDTANTDYSFRPDQSPFLAWPFDVAGGECGDTILVIVNEKKYWYKALDSGGFGKHCVVQPDGACARIAVDIPTFFAPFKELSHKVRVVNVSEEWRKFHERRPRRNAAQIAQRIRPAVISVFTMPSMVSKCVLGEMVDLAASTLEMASVSSTECRKTQKMDHVRIMCV
jgi:hypothetical protein